MAESFEVWKDTALLAHAFSNKILGQQGDFHKPIWIISNPGSIKPLHTGETADEYLEPLKKRFDDASVAAIGMPSHDQPFFLYRNESYAALEKHLHVSDIFGLASVKEKPAFQAYHETFPKPSLTQLALYYKLYKRVLKEYQPSVVVFIAGYSKLYSLVVAANELDIPTVELQHGRIHEDHDAYMHGETTKYVTPTDFIVQSEVEKQLLVEQSCYDDDEVQPLGIPRYDFLADYTADTSLRSDLDISADNILFWPTQTHDHRMSESGENEANARTVFKAISQLSNWHVLLKPHPNETYEDSEAFYTTLANKHDVEDFTIVPADYCLTYDCLAIADATVLKHSTVGIESLLMDTPVINLEVMESYPLRPYVDIDGFLKIEETDDLVQALKDTLSSEDYQQRYQKGRETYIEKHFSNFGSATDEVVAHIKEAYL